MQMQEDIKLDQYGRMQYHPDFHHNHKKRFTVSELEYLCKFYEVDHIRTLAFALGKTEYTCFAKVNELKKSGQYDHYKNLNMYW